MPEPAIPVDDLYARLGVDPGAGTAEIEASWRELMKLHHPDVAGPLSTELAQRINVARDWLSDPLRRSRYDASPRGRAARSSVGARRARHSGGSTARPDRRAAAGPARRSTTASPGPPPARAAARPLPRFDPWTADLGPRTEHVRAFLHELAALDPRLVARLAIGRVVTLVDAIPAFLPPERRGALDRVEAAVATILPAATRRDPVVLSAILGHAFALAIGDLVAPDELVAHLLSDPWRRATGTAA